VGTIGAFDYLLLEVADSGTGISPQVLKRIFEPFFTTKAVNVGNGLGLALVHGIVMDVGGAIDVASTPGSGSTFTVYLPRTGDAPDSNPDPGDHGSPRGHGERILVVDDEESLLRLTTERLVDLGYRAVGFTSSAAAIETFRADPNGFDAVITDERMPEISGSQVIREVRAIRRTIPILLVSGYVGGMVARRAYNEGADEVLKKPLSEQDLAAGLARVLNK
jgi:CheY-like chemotaxis protein